MSARSGGLSPRRRGMSPAASGRVRRSAAATAGSAAAGSSFPAGDKQEILVWRRPEDWARGLRVDHDPAFRRVPAHGLRAARDEDCDDAGVGRSGDSSHPNNVTDNHQLARQVGHDVSLCSSANDHAFSGGAQAPSAATRGLSGDPPEPRAGGAEHVACSLGTQSPGSHTCRAVLRAGRPRRKQGLEPGVAFCPPSERQSVDLGRFTNEPFWKRVTFVLEERPIRPEEDHRADG